jgi:hypothetical protein
VDIDLGLAAGGDAMKQSDRLLEEGELYLVEGLLLRQAEGFDVLGMRFPAVVQASHFLFVGLEDASLAKGRYRGEGMALVQEFVSCKRREESQIEEINKRLLLSRGTLEHVEGDMESLFRTELGGETDVGLGLRVVAIFGLQTCRKGCFIHLADGREVIVGYPTPEAELGFKEDGRRVEDLENGFDFVFLWNVECGMWNEITLQAITFIGILGKIISHSTFHIPHSTNHADISLIAAEGYEDTMTNGNLPLQLRRNGIGKHAVERERQDDVDVQFTIYLLTIYYLI